MRKPETNFARGRIEDANLFQLAVVQMGLPEQVGPGLLEPAHVVGVVDNAHLVGFIVVDWTLIGFEMHGFSHLL